MPACNDTKCPGFVHSHAIHSWAAGGKRHPSLTPQPALRLIPPTPNSAIWKEPLSGSSLAECVSVTHKPVRPVDSDGEAPDKPMPPDEPETLQNQRRSLRVRKGVGTADYGRVGRKHSPRKMTVAPSIPAAEEPVIAYLPFRSTGMNNYRQFSTVITSLDRWSNFE